MPESNSVMVTKKDPKIIESITIVAAKCLSSIERAKLGITQEDFAELRVVRNSPKD